MIPTFPLFGNSSDEISSSTAKLFQDPHMESYTCTSIMASIPFFPSRYARNQLIVARFTIGIFFW